jgi:hypothetical protein
VLTAALTDDALVDAFLGVYAQDGVTPLYIGCQQGHVGVVKLLLAHPDVVVNKAHKVRGRGCCRAKGGRRRCVGDKVRGGGDGC